MKFVLFVEGDTEKKALPDFLRRYLAPPRLTKRVGIKTVRFEGWPEYVKDIATKVHDNLGGKIGADVIAGIGLLDLYGPTFYPADKKTAAERYDWAKADIEEKVGHERFRRHFAVHETEAWLLSAPRIFPSAVADALPAKCAKPETVNFDTPPAKLLNDIYRQRLKRKYGKVQDGVTLFSKLSPDEAADRCPYLRRLLRDLVDSAKAAGC